MMASLVGKRLSTLAKSNFPILPIMRLALGIEIQKGFLAGQESTKELGEREEGEGSV